MKLKSILICKQTKRSKSDKFYEDICIDLDKTGQLLIMDHTGYEIVDTLYECCIEIVAADIIKGRAMEQVGVKKGITIYEPRIIYMRPIKDGVE